MVMTVAITAITAAVTTAITAAGADAMRLAALSLLAFAAPASGRFSVDAGAHFVDCPGGDPRGPGATRWRVSTTLELSWRRPGPIAGTLVEDAAGRNVPRGPGVSARALL